MWQTGQTVTVDFCTQHPGSGVATSADSLPTGSLVLNGTDNAAVVTVTLKTAGSYKASVVLPAVTDGDALQIRIAATVAGIAGKGVIWSGEGTAGVVLSNAGIDALFTRQLTESYHADGSAPTVAQALHAVLAFLFEKSISGTTLTAKKLDGSTQAMVFTLNDAASPSSITRTG